MTDEIADHDPVDMPLAERDLVDADTSGRASRFSWAFMYCISKALTVLQSSRSSLATSLMVALRQRRPT